MPAIARSAAARHTALRVGATAYPPRWPRASLTRSSLGPDSLTCLPGVVWLQSEVRGCRVPRVLARSHQRRMCLSVLCGPHFLPGFVAFLPCFPALLIRPRTTRLLAAAAGDNSPRWNAAASCFFHLLAAACACCCCCLTAAEMGLQRRCVAAATRLAMPALLGVLKIAVCAASPRGVVCWVGVANLVEGVGASVCWDK